MIGKITTKLKENPGGISVNGLAILGILIGLLILLGMYWLPAQRLVERLLLL